MKKYGILLSFLLLVILLPGCRKTPEQQLARALELARSGEWEKAEKISEHLVSKDPENFRFLLLRSVCCEKCGLHDPAVDCARRAVEKFPGSFTAQYTLGRLYARDPARQGEAMISLQKALALKPGDRNTMVLLCNVCSALKAPHTARTLAALLKAHRSEFLNTPELYYQLALAYLQRGDQRNAMNMLKYVAAAGAGNPALLLNTARCYDSENKKQEARNCYNEFLRRYSEKSPVMAREVQTRLAEMR